MIKKKEPMLGKPLGRRFYFLSPEAEARERLARERVGASITIRGKKFRKTLVGVR